MNPTSLQVCHAVDRHRFEVLADGEVAYLRYSLRGDRISLEHTHVPDSWRGRGVGAKLAQAALEDAKEKGWKVEIQCSFVAEYVKRHPEFRSLKAQSTSE
jgi:predicted GNAT family acetyltransferase